MPIKSLGLKNFKRFHTLDLSLHAPVTVLLGPNNSGKSSLLRALVGLKQTLAPSNDEEVFATQGDYVDLGTYADVVENHDTSKPIGIRLSFDLDDVTGEMLNPRIREPILYTSLDLAIDFGFDSITERPRIDTMIVTLHGEDDEQAILQLARKKTRPSFWFTCNETFQNHVCETRHYTSSKFAKREELENQQGRDKLSSGVSIEHHGRYIFEATGRYSERPVRRAFMIFRYALRLFTTELDKSMYYLGPLRGSPHRSYTQSTHVADVGPLGEYTPSVLAVFVKRAQHSTTGSKELWSRLMSFQDSLDSLFPGRVVRTETYEELVKLYVERIEAGSSKTRSSTQQKRVRRGPKTSRRRRTTESIADVGIGFSQALPILVQMAVMPKNATLLIEQPELHLHPRAQATLAEIVAARVREGRRFIIETHSEHFLRGLQLAVSNHAVNPKRGLSNKDVCIYYVPNAPSNVKEMPLNTAGELTDEWPSGFFDEAYRLSMKLFENKQKINKQNR